MKQYQGFVILAVLIFVQIYALLGISVLEQVFLVEKVTADQKARRLLFNEAQGLLRRLEASLDQSGIFCPIPFTPANQLVTRPLSWWAAFSCAESSHLFRAYYVVEALGDDPCAELRGAKAAVAAYYRLTLLLVNEHDETMRLMLQSTVVKEAETLEHCGSERHYVDLGPQSWHELFIN